MQQFVHRCLTRTPVLGLLMAALVFRALVPSGFMPGQDENGRMVMELCAGFATKSVVIDLDDGHSRSAGGESFERSQCGFTATALPALPPVPASFTASSRLHERIDAITLPTVLAPGLKRAQSPRGPPLA